MMRKLLLFSLLLATLGTLSAQEQTRFLPQSRRMDRGINTPGSVFGYRGESIMGVTASYGTISAEDADILVYLADINLDGAMTTIKPYYGYFYRDNRLIGIRLGYQYVDGDLGNLDLDLGEQNDIELNISGMEMSNSSYSVGIFHRAYVALDRRGQFGIFAEVEASALFGQSEFVNQTGETARYTKSDNMRFKLGFNPGVAVYVFPSVCATVSIGLGGLQYSTVEQFDELGNKVGTRRAAKMQFKLNLANINFGVNFHLWNKKKMAAR